MCTTFIWHFSLTCYGDILSKTAWNLKYSTVPPFLLCTFYAGYLPQRAYFKVVLVTKMSLNVSRIFFHPPLLFFSLTKLLFLEFPWRHINRIHLFLTPVDLFSFFFLLLFIQQMFSPTRCLTFCIPIREISFEVASDPRCNNCE